MTQVKQSSAKFITLEGIDGAGKSTHLNWLQQRLSARGLEVLVTREPGGTPLGEALRELLLHHPMHADSETMLMFAARREHLHSVIYPALARGAWVISDRFSDASYAYQGGGRGLAVAQLQALEGWVHGDFQPDLTLLFDVPVVVGKGRLSGKLDRFENEEHAFFQRVRDAYLQRARQFPSRIQVIDGTQSLKTIQDQLAKIVATL